MNAHPAEQDLPLIHVAIVEDDTGFLNALSRVVQGSAHMRLVGAACTRAEGLLMLNQPPADVLLVDLGLPDGSGIDVIRAAARQWPACSIMVSTNFGDETHVMQSIESGAAGYLLKDSSPTNMAAEIRNLASGGSPISPIIARQVLARFRQAAVPETGDGKTGQAVNANTDASSQTSPGPVAVLSAREKEVLDLITKGFTAIEIARLMELSHFTVRSFVRRIYSKLKVTSKAEAIYEARSQGLLPS